MTLLTVAVLSILLGFSLFLIVRRWQFLLSVCALCAAVVITWILFLIHFYRGAADAQLITGILLGTSITGGMYLLLNRLPRHWHIFRLPLFLSLFAIVYMALTHTIDYYTFALIVFVWGISGALFWHRSSPRLRSYVEAIIACCRNW